MSGLIHIYCGDGKGKTTAAVGLAVRAAGSGKKVVFAQFFKNGSSSEIKVLQNLEPIEVCICTTNRGFFYNMSDSEKEETQIDYISLFERVTERASCNADVLVLDEIISACNCHMVDEDRLVEFLQKKPDRLEVVLTGREPSQRLVCMADYVTEMKKIKHPYDEGINARLGIEF